MSKKRNWKLLTLTAGLSLATMVSCTNPAKENAYFKSSLNPAFSTTEYLEKHYQQFQNLQLLLTDFIVNLEEFLNLFRMGVLHFSKNEKKNWVNERVVEFFGGKNSALISALLKNFKKHFYRWSHFKIDNFDEGLLTSEERREEVYASFNQMGKFFEELRELPSLEKFGTISQDLEKNITTIESFFDKESKEILEVLQFVDIVGASDADYKKIALSVSEPLSNQSVEKFTLLESQIPTLRSWRESFFGDKNSTNPKNQFRTFWSVFLYNNNDLLGDYLSSQRPAMFLALLIFLLSSKMEIIKDSLAQLRVWLLAQKEFFNPIPPKSAALYKEISQSILPITAKIRTKVKETLEVNQKLEKLKKEIALLDKPLEELKDLIQKRDEKFEKLELSVAQGSQQKVKLKEMVQNFSSKAEIFFKHSLSEGEINIFSVFGEYTLLIQSFRETFDSLTKAQTNFNFFRSAARKIYFNADSFEDIKNNNSLNLIQFWEAAQVLKNLIAQADNFGLKNELFDLFERFESQLWKINLDFIKALSPNFKKSKEEQLVGADSNMLFQKVAEEREMVTSMAEVSKLAYQQLEIFQNLWDKKLLPHLFDNPKPTK